MKAAAHGLGRAALLALLVASGAGILVWTVVGGVETLLAFEFNDTGVSLARLGARVAVMLCPLVLLAVTAALSIFALARFSAKRLACATITFSAAIALIVTVPWARSPVDFIVALIEQAS